QEIQKMGIHYYPKEFGGIFLGQSSKKGQRIVISEMVVPVEFDSKTDRFTRYPSSLNKKIAEVYKSSEGRINYVGEWHTHPNGKTDYSKKDLKTMNEISLDSDVKTKKPLLLIVGVTKRIYQSSMYVFHDEELHKFKELIQK
ncbi:MAG: Mov34/MPN/PAD-1 family protein, partial [Flavobacteriales bacterium]|nr:Mov34/MPN/PAD-1 family protein [Flavobacteriales bacterium]